MLKGTFRMVSMTGDHTPVKVTAHFPSYPAWLGAGRLLMAFERARGYAALGYAEYQGQEVLVERKGLRALQNDAYLVLRGEELERQGPWEDPRTREEWLKGTARWRLSEDAEEKLRAAIPAPDAAARVRDLFCGPQSRSDRGVVKDLKVYRAYGNPLSLDSLRFCLTYFREYDSERGVQRDFHTDFIDRDGDNMTYREFMARTPDEPTYKNAPAARPQ